MTRRLTAAFLVACAGAVALAIADGRGESGSPRERPAALWMDSFDGGVGDRWETVQACCPHSVRTAPAAPSGDPAVRFELQPGDALDDGSSRAQLAAPRPPGGPEIALRDGTERYFGWRMRLDRNYPTDPDRWTILVAWKEDDDGEGPLKLSTSFEPGSLRLEGPGGDSVYWRAPIVREAWIDFVARIRFSPDPRVGYVELWHRRPGQEGLLPQRLTNGRRRAYFATMEPGVPQSYLKVGLYRDPSFEATSAAWFDDLAIGRSLPEVDPGQASASGVGAPR